MLQLSIYIVSGFAVGFLVHKWITPELKNLTKKTSFKSDDLIINTIDKWLMWWFVALGLFLGLKKVNMENKYHIWLENGLMIFYLFSLTLILAKIISGMLSIKAKGTDTSIPSSSIVENITRGIIYCIGLLFILQSQGVSITPVLTALGVGGLAVALALQPTLSNLFAGLQLIASGTINHGDFIRLASGEDGFVVDINWRSTTMRAASDHTIIIPNSKLADMIVSNYHLPFQEINFAVDVGVSYNSDLNHVERVTKEVIKETLNEIEGGVPEFEPIVRFSSFADSSINLKAILRVKEYASQFLVKSEFIKKLHERYNKEGINIPFPIRTLQMQKEIE